MRGNWVRALSIFVAIIGTTLHVGCGRGKPIKVGFVANLSGRSSQLGIAGRNGVQLAIDQINSSGGIDGHPIKLIIRDNTGNTDVCRRVVDEISAEGCRAIIGPYTSNMVQTTLEAASEAGLLVLSPTASTDAMRAKDDLFLRVIPVATQQGEVLASAALSQGHDSLTVVCDSDNADYTLAVARGFTRTLEEAGRPKVILHEYRKVSELAAIAKEIADDNNDGVLIISSGIDAGALCQLFSQKQLNIQLFGSTWVKASNVIAHGGRAAEGMILVAPYQAKTPSAHARKFYQAYQERYHAAANFSAVYSYEAANLLAQGLRDAKRADAQSIKQVLLGQRDIQGVQETFQLDAFGDVKRNLSLFIIRGATYEIWSRDG